MYVYFRKLYNYQRGYNYDQGDLFFIIIGCLFVGIIHTYIFIQFIKELYRNVLLVYDCTVQLEIRKRILFKKNARLENK